MLFPQELTSHGERSEQEEELKGRYRIAGVFTKRADLFTAASAARKQDKDAVWALLFAIRRV